MHVFRWLTVEVAPELPEVQVVHRQDPALGIEVPVADVPELGEEGVIVTLLGVDDVAVVSVHAGFWAAICHRLPGLIQGSSSSARKDLHFHRVVRRDQDQDTRVKAQVLPCLSPFLIWNNSIGNIFRVLTGRPFNRSRGVTKTYHFGFLEPCKNLYIQILKVWSLYLYIGM